MIELEIVSDSRTIKWSIAVAAVLVCWYVIAVIIAPRVEYNSKEMESKQNLHSIQLALERFAVDSEANYPRDLNELIAAGYLDQFPLNPFEGRPMRGVVYDWRSDMPKAENEAMIPRQPKGDFVYIHRYGEDTESKDIVGYTLVVY